MNLVAGDRAHTAAGAAFVAAAAVAWVGLAGFEPPTPMGLVGFLAGPPAHRAPVRPRRLP